MSAEATQERREIHYSGRVQGVGFRYTVRWVATRFAVAGFVKNLPDGCVQLVAEGPPDQLRGFLEAIHAEMGQYIVDVREQVGPTTGGFRGFEIRF